MARKPKNRPPAASLDAKIAVVTRHERGQSIHSIHYHTGLPLGMVEGIIAEFNGRLFLQRHRRGRI